MVLSTPCCSDMSAAQIYGPMGLWHGTPKHGFWVFVTGSFLIPDNLERECVFGLLLQYAKIKSEKY